MNNAGISFGGSDTDKTLNPENLDKSTINEVIASTLNTP